MIPKFITTRLENWRPAFSPRLFRFFLAGMLVAAVVVPLALAAMPFIEFFNDMAAQPKGKTQMTYGRLYGAPLVVERAPVPGTVPRDWYPYAFADLGNDVKVARAIGERNPNPVPVTLENLQRGQKLYNIYCIACHGERGLGDGPVTAVTKPGRFPPPPSLHTENARTYKDGSIYHIVTMGMGKMPSYADKLDPEDRWKVIHYVRALQRSMNPKPEDRQQ